MSHLYQGRAYWPGRILSLVTLAGLWTSPLAAQGHYEVAGDEVAIYNLAGILTVEGGGGSSVSVGVTRRGSDAQRLRVEVGPIDGRQTLRVVYPDDEIVYSSMGRQTDTEVRVRDDGTFGDKDHHGEHRREGRQVHIVGSGRGLEASADLRVRVPAAQRITLYLAVGEATLANVDGKIVVDVNSAPVSATGTKGSLVIDTGSGAVDVTDAQGSVVIDTGSGNVSATRVRGETLLIDTGSGAVTVSSVNVENLNIDTGSGRIDVSGASAKDVLLDTGSGSVNLEMTSNPDHVAIDTGSGGVTFTVPATYSATVEIDTGSGSIDVDFPVQIRRWERTHVAGTIGNGRGVLEIDTGSGSVKVRKGS